MGCWQHTRPYRGHIYHLSNQLNRHNLSLCHTWKHLAHSCMRFHKSSHTKTRHTLKKGKGNTTSMLKVRVLYCILRGIFSLFLYNLFCCNYKFIKFQNGGRVLQLVLPLHVRPSLSKVWKSGHVQLYDPSTFTHRFGKEHLFKLASLHSSISEIYTIQFQCKQTCLYMYFK